MHVNRGSKDLKINSIGSKIQVNSVYRSYEEFLLLEILDFFRLLSSSRDLKMNQRLSSQISKSLESFKISSLLWHSTAFLPEVPLDPLGLDFHIPYQFQPLLIFSSKVPEYFKVPLCVQCTFRSKIGMSSQLERWFQAFHGWQIGLSTCN